MHCVSSRFLLAPWLHSANQNRQKKFGDKILAIFCSWNGVWGEPGFVRPSVRPSVRVPKTRTFRIAKKGQVAKKNETADDGGLTRTTQQAACRRAQRPPATLTHAQAHAANHQIWHSEKW